MISKKQARRIISEKKPGCTVKEFMYMCNDMGVWVDCILGTKLETVYYILNN